MTEKDEFIGIYIGKPKTPTGYRWIEKIKDYEVMDSGKYYVIDMYDRCFIEDEVVSFKPSEVMVGNNYYKVAEENIREV